MALCRLRCLPKACKHFVGRSKNSKLVDEKQILQGKDVFGGLVGGHFPSKRTTLVWPSGGVDEHALWPGLRNATRSLSRDPAAVMGKEPLQLIIKYSLIFYLTMKEQLHELLDVFLFGIFNVSLMKVRCSSVQAEAPQHCSPFQVHITKDAYPLDTRGLVTRYGSDDCAVVFRGSKSLVNYLMGDSWRQLSAGARCVTRFTNAKDFDFFQGTPFSYLTALESFAMLYFLPQGWTLHD